MAAPTPQEQPQEQSTNQPVNTPSVKTKKNTPLIIALVLIFLLMAGGLAYFGYQNYQLKNQIRNLDTEVTQPTLTSAAYKLAEFHQDGGFAGRSDQLVVYTDGSASLFNIIRDEQRDFQVEPEVFNQLIGLFQQFNQLSFELVDDVQEPVDIDSPELADDVQEPVDIDSVDPDSLHEKLIFYGQGQEKIKQEQEDIIKKLMRSILIQNEF
jgi:hypothetical protein